MIRKFAIILGVTAVAATAHPSPEHKLKEIEEHLVEHPDDPALLRLKANLLIERRPKKAAKIVRKLISLDPENRENRLLEARYQAVTGKPVKARNALRILVKEDPELVDAWGLLSQLEDATGERDAAISAAIESVDRSSSPSPTRILTSVGWLRERANPGDVETSIRLINRGLSRLGCLTRLHEVAMEMEIETGKFDAALSRIDAIEGRYRPTVALELRRADILEMAQRYGKAADACDVAIALMDLSPASRKKSPEFQQQWSALAERKAANLEKAGR